MINSDDYFGKWINHPDAERSGVRINADKLMESVNRLIPYAVADGVEFHVNPKTGTYISGSEFGGFRPQVCPQGAPLSSHKTGQGVDIYDPQREFANWCFNNQDVLAECGLYMEHPSATVGWCHLTTRPPKSKKRAFYP